MLCIPYMGKVPQKNKMSIHLVQVYSVSNLALNLTFCIPAICDKILNRM